MGRRLYGVGVLSVASAALALGLAPVPATGEGGVVCPPVTIETLFPAPSPTSPPDSDPTGTVPATTTVSPPDTTVSTAPPTTGSTAPPTTGTTAPPTTATTAPPTTGTTAPPTTRITEPPEPECDTPFVYPMVFPLLGSGQHLSSFGADRDGGARYHLGNDIAAPHLQPVVAVAAGTVTRIGPDQGISGFRVHLRHDDGWSTLYIHLNNDTAGTDDGNGVGIRPDLRPGDRVEAGQVLGWNGDSGNAEDGTAHLHFELRDPEGVPVDPGPSLAAAARPPGPGFSGPFIDGPDPTGHVDPLAVLLSRGVPVWCDAAGIAACGDDSIDAHTLRIWMSSLLADGLRPGLAQPRAAAASPESVCRPGCRPPAVTELDVARWAAWVRMRRAYDLHMSWLDTGIPDWAWTTPPPKPPADPARLSPLRAYESLEGARHCLPVPDGRRALTRREAGAAMVLYLGWGEPPTCVTSSANR